MANGADVNAQTPNSEETPLHYAARGPSVKSVRVLIEQGATLDIEDVDRDIPLDGTAGRMRWRIWKPCGALLFVYWYKAVCHCVRIRDSLVVDDDYDDPHIWNGAITLVDLQMTTLVS